MAYRMYNALDCEYCHKEQGLIDGSGRERRYCSQRCRQAAYRQRQQQKRNAEVLRNNSALEQRWYLASIGGELLQKLRAIYIAHGESAAALATDAVLLAAQQTREALRR